MNTRHPSLYAVALLLVAAIALSGCSPKKLQPAFEPVYDDPYSFEAYLEKRKKIDRASMTQEERFAYDNRTASLSTMRHSGIPLPNLHLIEQAKTALGTPYVSGGTDTEGFDCSGFVQWAYRSVGVNLPRTAREQSVMGSPIKSGSMMAGDIVAFNHPRRGYHTGIYLGDGSFIHSPGRGKSVSIAALSDPYFSSTFIGARRVQSGESDAEAIKKLMALDSRQPARAHKAALASSQKRSATRKQTAAADHKTTRADARPKASATPIAKQDAAQGKKNSGATAAASKQAASPQTAAKAAAKGTPLKKGPPGKQAAQGTGSPKSTTPPKTAQAPEPAKNKAAPAKPGKDKTAQPANTAKAKAEKAQSAPKPSPGEQKTAQAKTPSAGKNTPKAGGKAATPPSVKAAAPPQSHAANFQGRRNGPGQGKTAAKDRAACQGNRESPGEGRPGKTKRPTKTSENA